MLCLFHVVFAIVACRIVALVLIEGLVPNMDLHLWQRLLLHLQHLLGVQVLAKRRELAIVLIAREGLSPLLVHLVDL